MKLVPQLIKSGVYRGQAQVLGLARGSGAAVRRTPVRSGRTLEENGNAEGMQMQHSKWGLIKILFKSFL